MPSSPTVPSSSPTARLLFLGDTSFGENYQERIAAAGGENVLKTRGYDSMIANFAAILDGAALVVANLETPVTDLRSSPLAGRKRYVHYGDAEETPHQLAKYGIRLVSLGNNHAMDMGAAGLAQSLASLVRHGIATCGAGKDGTLARRPYRRQVGVGPMTLRLAVLCALDIEVPHLPVGIAPLRLALDDKGAARDGELVARTRVGDLARTQLEGCRLGVDAGLAEADDRVWALRNHPNRDRLAASRRVDSIDPERGERRVHRALEHRLRCACP
jgi:hypothetical protein